MDKAKHERRLKGGRDRWQAPRMKPVVKKLGTKNIKKPKKEKEGE